MYKHKYKKGDIVEVFDDPITKQKQEGKAKIVKLRDINDYYDVEFVDGKTDWDDEKVYSRFVY